MVYGPIGVILPNVTLNRVVVSESVQEPDLVPTQHPRTAVKAVQEAFSIESCVATKNVQDVSLLFQTLYIVTLLYHISFKTDGLNFLNAKWQTSSCNFILSVGFRTYAWILFLMIELYFKFLTLTLNVF